MRHGTIVWPEHGAELVAATSIWSAVGTGSEEGGLAIWRRNDQRLSVIGASMDVTGPSEQSGTDRQLLAARLGSVAARRDAELRRGVCLVGPHRDDLILATRRSARERVC